MQITRARPKFPPISIVLESQEELENMLYALDSVIVGSKTRAAWIKELADEVRECAARNIRTTRKAGND